MTRWIEDPEGAADALFASVLQEGNGPGAGAYVLAGYQYGDGATALRNAGCDTVVWNRHMRGGRLASAAPPDRSFDACVLRLPKPRHEQEMALHQMLSRTRDGGRVFVYGGNDEGIRSFQKTFATLVESCETVATRGHGRVLAGVRDGRPVRGELSDWVQHSSLPIDGVAVPWVSYPGLFAGGSLDTGTALLLHSLPAFARPSRVLDFGAGTGVIARALLSRSASIDVTLVDNDSVALLAASANVPGATVILGDSLAVLPRDAPFDVIVSNPPLHAGVREDHGALDALVSEARYRLTADGAIWMVVQRRVPCAPMLEAAFNTVEIIAEDTRFRVWHASRPKPAVSVKGGGQRRVRPREE